MIIFVESPSTVVKIAEQLSGKVACLTGTMRGKERDELIDNPIFQAFTAPQEPSDQHFLVATSAGEVGIDLTCDTLITDVAQAQSLVQRFGRCNRFGEGTGLIYVVLADNDKEKARFTGDLSFIQSLNGDASCQNLWNKRSELAALAHVPEVIPSLEPRVLDVLSMTSLKNNIDVDEYLRGRQRNNRYVDIAFRTEAELLAEMNSADLEAFLKHFPLLSFEKLSEKASSVVELIEEVNNKDLCCAVIMASGETRGVTLSDLLEMKLTNCTVILPDNAGLGLKAGMLIQSDSYESLDVSTIEHKHHPARTRLILDADEEYVASKTEKVVFDCTVNSKRIVIVKQKQITKRGTELLSDHQAEVAAYAKEFAEKAGLDAQLVEAITEAARYHDHGKANPVWQLAARGGNVKKPIAKTSSVSWQRLAGFRHEFESMDIVDSELTKHLIGAHHAGARPSWGGIRCPSNHGNNKLLMMWWCASRLAGVTAWKYLFIVMPAFA